MSSYDHHELDRYPILQDAMIENTALPRVRIMLDWPLIRANINGSVYTDVWGCLSPMRVDRVRP